MNKMIRNNWVESYCIRNDIMNYDKYQNRIFEFKQLPLSQQPNEKSDSQLFISHSVLPFQIINN